MNCTSAISSGRGDSTLRHMPAAWGSAEPHPVKLKAPGAAEALWLAVTFHAASGAISTGSVASSSGAVHIILRDVVAVRTRATSATDTVPPVLPNEFRTYDE